MSTFRDNVPAERLETIQQEGLAEILPYIEALQEQSEGVLADHEPATILGLVSTIGLLVLHREEYEEYDDEYYDLVQELLITTLARGLTAD